MKGIEMPLKPLNRWLSSNASVWKLKYTDVLHYLFDLIIIGLFLWLYKACCHSLLVLGL